VGDDAKLLQGEVQLEVMKAVWRTGGGSVEDIRRAMPARYRGAYTTTQTVLNRLAERGLLRRTPGEAARGPTGRITYRAAIREEDYFEQSLEQALAGASREARRVAVSRLAGRLADEEIVGGRDAGEKSRRRR
jgi:predicted transcriptional regulator